MYRSREQCLRTQLLRRSRKKNVRKQKCTALKHVLAIIPKQRICGIKWPRFAKNMLLFLKFQPYNKPAPLWWRTKEIITMTKQQHIINRNNACLLVRNLRGLHISDDIKWEEAMKLWKKFHQEQK